MHALGIPTTRALSLVVSNATRVLRDPMYDGHPVHEPCAVVMRVAPCFVRLGSFQVALPRDPLTGREGPSARLPDSGASLLRQLVAYTVNHAMPLPAVPAPLKPDDVSRAVITALFEQTCQRTARLVAQWQLVGFCHGVLNTDNLSVLGLTLDYGPFGFMDW